MIYLYNSDKISNEICKIFINLENVKEYQKNIILKENDIILIIKYWHIHSIKSIIEKKNYNRGLLNINVQGKNEFIIDENIKKILLNDKSRILLFNSWETRDLYNCNKILKTFVIDYLKIPFNKFYFSTANYLNHMNIKKSNILSYDWVYLSEKYRFNKKFRLNYDSKKNYRLISLNRGGNYERFYYCCYLFNNFADKINFSFLNETGLDFKKFNNYKRFNLIKNDEWNKFYNIIPKKLDSLNPDWYNNDNINNDISKYLEESYIQVIFETNSQSINSNSQQISEKSYMGIRNGQPFILFTTTGGILEHLKKIGFKTFHPFIDESYDLKTLTYEQRYKLLLNESKKLCEISEEEIKYKYEKMRPIIEHNLSIIENKKIIPNILKFIK